MTPILTASRNVSNSQWGPPQLLVYGYLSGWPAHANLLTPWLEVDPFSEWITLRELNNSAESGVKPSVSLPNEASAKGFPKRPFNIVGHYCRVRLCGLNRIPRSPGCALQKPPGTPAMASPGDWPERSLQVPANYRALIPMHTAAWHAGLSRSSLTAELKC